MSSGYFVKAFSDYFQTKLLPNIRSKTVENIVGTETMGPTRGHPTRPLSRGICFHIDENLEENFFTPPNFNPFIDDGLPDFFPLFH